MTDLLSDAGKPKLVKKKRIVERELSQVLIAIRGTKMSSGHVDLDARRAGIGACLVAQLSGVLSGFPVLPNVRISKVRYNCWKC